MVNPQDFRGEISAIHLLCKVSRFKLKLKCKRLTVFLLCLFSLLHKLHPTLPPPLPLIFSIYSGCHCFVQMFGSGSFSPGRFSFFVSLPSLHVFVSLSSSVVFASCLCVCSAAFAVFVCPAITVRE